MHAWRGHAYGPPESLRWDEVPDRPLGDGEARVAVRASAVNFPDVLYVAGTYQIKPVPPFVPGFEIAGEIVESRCAELPVGARIASTLDGSGGYATHAIATPMTTHRIPDAMPFEDAAAITVTYQTGHFALHRRARLTKGEVLLVHAGAGGVGSAAIQLGKAAGAMVIATAGGAKKVEACLALGADFAVDYTKDDFVAVVKAKTGGRGADVVFDPVGGEVFEKSTKCIAWEGRIVVIGFTSGRFPEARPNHILVKNYAVVGLHWGMYNLHDPAAVRATQADLYRLWGEGKIKPLVSEILPLSEAPAAMAKVASRASIGKILLRPLRWRPGPNFPGGAVFDPRMESDEALYARVRAGDMVAFDALYERYAARLYGFLVSELGGGGDAEEVFHEAFLATLKADGLSFDVGRGGGFRAYLYRAAKNRAHNRRRGHRRGAEAIARAPLPESPRRPDDALADEQRAAALDRAVHGLPASLREVYRLRTSGLSYEEIAAVLEIPLGTLKSRMHHLVHVLKEELKPWTAPLTTPI